VRRFWLSIVLVSPVFALCGIASAGAEPVHLSGITSPASAGVYDWGNEPTKGGLGSGSDLSVPTLASNTSQQTFTSIDAEDGFGYALETGGTVLSWGDNNDGQLGIGNKTQHAMSAVQVKDLSGVIQVDGGNDFGLALRDDGTVWAWGNGADGNMGNGTQSGDVTIPQQVPGLSDVVQVSAGDDHSLALLSNGTVMAWGANGSGQLGDGTFTLSPVPVAVSNLTGAVAISAGNLFSEALLSDGKVEAWGYNQFGQLGDGNTKQTRDLPVVVHDLTGVVQISAGGSQNTNGHSLALLSDGTVMAWGNDVDGQLCDGVLKKAVDSPVQVSGISDAAQVSAGGMHSMILDTSGDVFTCGSNAYGQLGDGTTTNESLPEEVMTGVTEISAGSLHSEALVPALSNASSAGASSTAGVRTTVG
jgi:alpha-tubulin suppressor-like RCC1 family protein